MTTHDSRNMTNPPGLARYVLPALFSTVACQSGPEIIADITDSFDASSDSYGDGDGDSNGDGDGDGSGGLVELRSELPHDQNPQLGPGEAEALAAANHALTLDLYHALRNNQAAGVGFSISAYSIESAFAMLYAGSLDPARSEIAQTLHFDLPGDQQHVAHNWLDAQLESRNIPAAMPGDGDGDADGVELKSANGLWLLDDLADGVSSSFLDLLSIHYDAGLKLADFDVDPELAREGINGWVSDRTGGLIPSLFPMGSIHDLTKFVLVNALYLRAPWAEPFPTGTTEFRDFTLLDNQVVPVEMMRAPGLGSARYAVGVDYQAAGLSLRGGQLEIVVILPLDFASFEANLDATKLDEVLDGLAVELLDLSMPKLELASSFELTPELQSLGMNAPFDDITSFDGIHGELGYIQVVVHQTVIKWDEDGVEAAAATGIGGDGDGDTSPPEPTVMVVDRPFLLAIRDRPTDTLLFFGRVLDPSN